MRRRDEDDMLESDAVPQAIALRHGPRGVVLLALLAIASCLYAVPVRWERDTQLLHLGLNELVASAANGCRGPVQAGPFPPFQYLTGLPIVLANRAGVPVNIFWVWAFMSLLGFGGISWVLWRTAARHASKAAAWLLVVVVLTGPLLTSAPSTFNELPAALLTLLFASSAVGRGEAATTALLFIAAGLTKEVAAPLLVPIWLGGLALRRAELGRAGMTRHAIAMAAAIVATMAAHAGFNFIRYRSVLNLHYLAPDHLTASWSRRAQNAAALWFAPNGGVIPFWPTLAAVIAIAVALSGRAWRRGPLIKIVPAAAVVAMLAALTAGLAGFYQPFGWWCWGPRLMLPWLPAGLLVFVRAYPRSFDRTARMLLERRAAFAATGAIACLLALPHLMMLANPSTVTDFFMPDEKFPRGAPAAEPELHYARQVFLAWQKWPPLLAWPFRPAPGVKWIAATAGYLAAVIALLWHARTSLPPRPPLPGHVSTA